MQIHVLLICRLIPDEQLQMVLWRLAEKLPRERLQTWHNISIFTNENRSKVEVADEIDSDSILNDLDLI